MAITILAKNGYGQVEPNHLTAQRTGQVYAQLPVASATLTTLGGVVQNGLFLDYDYASGTVKVPAAGGSKLTMLVMNEVRLYADFLTAKDFAQIANGTAANIGLAPEAGTTVYPRVYKLNVGDIITTNLVAAEGTGVIGDYAVGDTLSPAVTGILNKVTAGSQAVQLKVAAITTTPDLQPALKLQVVAAG